MIYKFHTLFLNNSKHYILNRWYVFSFIIITVCSCNKEDIKFKCKERQIRKQAKNCQEYDFSSCGYGINYIAPNSILHSPVFNPNTNEEFIYIEILNGEYYLKKYSIRKNKITTIVSNKAIIGQPSWSRNDWIVFSSSDWKIWKVKTDGSELTQISNTPRDLYPEFNYKGDLIIYSRNMDYSNSELKENPDLRNRSKMVIIDINGNEVDSICIQTNSHCQRWSISNWGISNKILHVLGDSEFYGVSRYNYNLNQEEGLLLNYKLENNELSDIEWGPGESSIFYRNKDGIYVHYLSSNETYCIRHSCDSDKYGNFSISSDGTKLITVKEKGVKIGSCSLSIIHEILIMGIDGCDEEIINM